MHKADLIVSKLSDEVTMEVDILLTKELKFRIWAATKLIKLASLILGAEIKVEKESA